MIDFTDPAQMMHRGETIPINVRDKFDATRDAAMAVYEAAHRPWDDDAEQQLERRVLNGKTTAEIIALTLEDRKARFDE